MSPPVVLDSSLCIVIPANATFGVRYAAWAVADDVGDVFGSPARVCEAAPADARLVLELHDDHRCDGESFSIRATTNAKRTTIRILSGGERGAIYGLYHFSHQRLGTDRLKHFTGYKPPRRDRLELRDLDEDVPASPVRFRGWHVEGISVLESWNPSAHSLGYRRYLELLLETLLRLGGNMVKPNTNRPESMEVALAQKMGLLITQEHCCPFGVGMWDIHSDEPGFDYSFDRFAHVYLRTWEDALLRYPRPENVIWTLGFRGRGDRPFWMEDPSYDTDAQRGKLISRVLDIQRDLVLKHCAAFKPAFIHNTWMEGNRLLAQGHTKLPGDTITVWADNGYGTFRAMIAEGCPPEEVLDPLPARAPDAGGGTYYHVSMWDFNTPFLTQFVPLSRIEKQLGGAVGRGFDAYLLVNMGRLRNCLLGAAAIADLWRDPAPWVAGGRARSFLEEWCARYFAPAAADAARCYRALWDTPFPWGRWGGWDDYVIGDVGYTRRARLFVDQALSMARRRTYEAMKFKFWENQPMTLAQQLAYMRGHTAAAAPQWQAACDIAQAIERRLDGAALAFFRADVVSQLRVSAGLNRYLQHVIDAVSAYESDPGASCLREARSALDRLDEVEAALRLLDAGAFTGYVTPQLLQHACLPLARQTARMLLDTVELFTTRRAQAF